MDSIVALWSRRAKITFFDIQMWGIRIFQNNLLFFVFFPIWSINSLDIVQWQGALQHLTYHECLEEKIGQKKDGEGENDRRRRRTLYARKNNVYIVLNIFENANYNVNAVH